MEELFLKKKNKKFFIQKLINNLNILLEDFSFVSKKINNCILELEFKNLEKADEAYEKLISYLIGVSNISLCSKTELNLNKIQEEINKIYNNHQFNIKSFKIKTKRHNKDFEYNSQQINEMVGSYVVENLELKVDVHNPDFIFQIEIFRNYCLVVIKKCSGIDGLPVENYAAGLHMISGGIDSPVAAFQLLKKGNNVDFVHFYFDHKDHKKAIEKVETEIKLLNNYKPNLSKLFLIDITLLINELQCTCPDKYKTIVLKKIFYLISQYILNRHKYLFFFIWRITKSSQLSNIKKFMRFTI